MLYPRFEEVREYTRRYSVIPVCKTIFADTETPIRLYRRWNAHPYTFLLESVEGGEKWGRYSFIGTDPFLVFRSSGRHIRMEEKGRIRTMDSPRPLEELNRLLRRYRAPSYPGYPPFLGGAVGYAGFETVCSLEPVPRHSARNTGTGAYDLHWMFCDRLIIMDHLRQKIVLVLNLHVSGDPGEDRLRSQYDQAVQYLEDWAEELQTRREDLPYLPPIWPEGASGDDPNAVSNWTKEEYCRVVAEAQEHIRRGDVYQIVLSQRWKRDPAPDPFEVYRVLRVLNPSPYMYHLSLGDEQVVGTSPELLVRVTDGTVETRPIAGTRRRGKDPREDGALAEELLRDEKERAEHVMLVDMGRNDLGRVCRFGSVRVTEQMGIERYSHVMHMVSHVKGELAGERTPLDAFAACFPAGTVSGAPKVRAMELITTLEPEPRGIYAGAVGYISFTGNLDTCIAIRTVYFRDGVAYIQAGGGIVADSVPEREYEESLNKARGMMRALELAEKMVSTPHR